MAPLWWVIVPDCEPYCRHTGNLILVIKSRLQPNNGPRPARGRIMCISAFIARCFFFSKDTFFFLEFSNQLMTIRLAFIVLLSENFLIIYNLKKIAVCQVHY